MSTIITDTIINEIENNQEWQDKMDRQYELEELMRTKGVDRYNHNYNKRVVGGKATETSSVKRLMHYSIDLMVEGIKEWIANAKTGRAGRKHRALEYMELIEPEVMALMTSRVALDSVARGGSGEILIKVACRIGSMIEDELDFRNFKDVDKESFSKVSDRERKQHGGNYRLQRLVMVYNINARNIERLNWSKEVQARLGCVLLEIMVAKTGLIQIQTIAGKTKNQTETVIQATQETMEWINEENTRCEVLTPVYLPTIVPPRPWTSPFNGGYWSARVRRLKLVKSFSREYLDELSEHDMPKVYDAVNAMQHTPWAINQKVFATAKQLWELGSTLGGVPNADDQELPQRPQFMVDDVPKETWTEEQKQEFKKWKRSSVDVYNANARAKSLRIQFLKILNVAEMFTEEEEIYFPYQMDFRGRVYAVPLFLNPQGSDLAKGLLEFANAVSIDDEEGAGWLAVHGANVYGYDKVSLEDRIAWVSHHEERILAVSNDPLEELFWTEADSPFQFLAFCFEWAAFKKEGYGYLSSLPVQMDGSCNGLQNFSAMLRDPIGGKAVNLLPSDKPADIYQAVADVVLKQVEKDVHSSDEKISSAAKDWMRFGINRKVCKRPVMTLAYGAKQFGFQQQVFDDTVHPAQIHGFVWTHTWGAASYLGKVIWNSVGKVVVAARHAMDWLQKAARAASAEGLPVRWETPDGLVVVQMYPKIKTKRIEITFNGVRLAPTLAVEALNEFDKTRQANAISPNWVHSMDASHMRATVRDCWGQGIRSFALVHDSYGTHAGNAWALAQSLRNEFVELYKEDVLEIFKTELERQLPVGTTLDELPPKGTLDLEAVKESLYFFA